MLMREDVVGREHDGVWNCRQRRKYSSLGMYFPSNHNAEREDDGIILHPAALSSFGAPYMY